MTNRMTRVLLPTALIVALGAAVSRAEQPAPGSVEVTVQAPDEDLAAAVELTLRHDPFTFIYRLGVSAADGAVTLTGKVESEFAKKRVELTAARIQGVKAVRNLLVIDPKLFVKPDWQIKEDVQSEFVWSPLVPAHKISVQVADGVVTLRGEVADLEAVQSAMANAFQGGAKKVVNELTLKPHVNLGLGSPWRALR